VNVEEENRLNYCLVQDWMMKELVKVEKGILQLWKGLVTHIHVLCSGHAGQIGVNVDPMAWFTGKEDAKTLKQTYYLVKSRIVERNKVIKKKDVGLF
jgi:hypothetical protein